MLLLKRIKLTVRLWLETKEHGYTLRDCWYEAGDMLDRTEPFRKWYNDAQKARERDNG